MNSIYFTADLHFSHYNIALHCSRMPWICNNPYYNQSKPFHFRYNNPYSVNLKAHDEALIENWNKTVKKRDIVYILGDFAWKYHNHYLMALNGKKILTKGNHDKANGDFYRNFSEVHDFGCGKNINGQDITLCHYAMRSWASSFHGSISLYGHSHGRMPEFDNMLSFDVGIDCWGYAPVSFDVIMKKIQIKKNWIKEHGKYPLDGESKADGQYSLDPEKRVLETRAKNKEILKSLGYPIVEEMWPIEYLIYPSSLSNDTSISQEDYLVEK